MLGAVALGGLAPFLAHWATSYVDSSQNLILFMSWPVAMMLLLAAGEWLFRDGDQWLTLAWMGGCCLAAAALETLADFFIRYGSLPYAWKSLAILPLLAVFTWPAIPAGVGLARQGRKVRAMGVTAIVAIMACYAFTFEWGVFELAKPSIRGNGPFSRNFGVLFLENRGRESDYEFILDQLRGADWSLSYGFRGSKASFADLADDWRPTAVKALVRHDPAWAAEHLARLLVDRPSRQLIDMTEDLFAEQHRYETAPILIRYAFVEEGTYPACSGAGHDRFTKALEELRVPQAASVLLVKTIFAQRMRELAEAKRSLHR